MEETDIHRQVGTQGQRLRQTDRYIKRESSIQTDRHMT